MGHSNAVIHSNGGGWCGKPNKQITMDKKDNVENFVDTLEKGIAST